MKISQNGIDLIKKFEGLSLEPYKDIAGVWTIGYGRAHGVNAFDNPITESKAEEYLIDDLHWVEKAISENVKVRLSQNQYDALASLIFNVGPGSSSKDGIIRLKSGEPSTVLRKLNSGDYAGAAEAMLAWHHAGGKESKGLMNRRQTERNLFLKGGDPIMLPFVAAAIPALIEAAPDLIRLFGGGEQSEKNAKSAEKLVQIAKQATGADTAEGAVSAIQSNPEHAEEFRKAAYAQFLELEALSEKSVQTAREFSTSEKPIYHGVKFIHILSMILILFSGTGGLIVINGEFPPEMKGSVITLMLIGGFTSVVAFWLGSSNSSQRKDEFLNQK